MCGQRMSTGLMVAMEEKEKGKLQGIPLAEPTRYLIRAMLIFTTIMRV